MAYDPAFDDPWLKWRWAVQNADMLDAAIKRRLKGEAEPPFATAQRYHPTLHGFSVYVSSVQPDVEWWGLWLGDVIHAYRSCLDHLAWTLVDRGRTPTRGLSEETQRKISFPSCTSSGWFNRAVQTRLPGCVRTDVAKVRAVQPYKAGKRRQQTHPLALLDSLSNSEKHRTIQPVQRHQEALGYYSVTPVDCSVRRIRVMPPAILRPGTETARVYVKRTGPHPDIEMHGYMAARVSLNGTLALDRFLSLDPPTRYWLWLGCRRRKGTQCCNNWCSHHANRPQPRSTFSMVCPV